MDGDEELNPPPHSPSPLGNNWSLHTPYTHSHHSHTPAHSHQYPINSPATSSHHSPSPLAQSAGLHHCHTTSQHPTHHTSSHRCHHSPPHHNSFNKRQRCTSCCVCCCNTNSGTSSFPGSPLSISYRDNSLNSSANSVSNVTAAPTTVFPAVTVSSSSYSSSRTTSGSSSSDMGDMSFMYDYIKEAMKAMEMMRGHHMLTDVVLEVDTELFHAHRVVLAAASPYFKAMFTGGLRESEMDRVKLQGVSPTAMGRLIQFMYTGRIRVTENTVCQLLPAATMFQVSNVIQACCDFLERQLDPSNAIGIANFAEQHGCNELCKKANQYIERHFSQICQEEEFLQLNCQQLISLIKKDELNVQDEKEVYNSVLKWVKYDEDSRYIKMEHILSAVRCQFLTPKFLNDQMANCDVLRKTPACREYLAKIFKDLTLHKRTIVKERTPNTPRIIYIVGGYYKQSLNILEGYNVDDKTWTQLDSLRVPRSGLGGAFLRGTFYAVGGRSNTPGNSYDSDWVDKYDPLKDQWRPCSPMSVPRNRVGVAVMDGLLYAVGGSDRSEFHSSVECYDPEQDRWMTIKSMHSKRLAVGVAVVNRLLYAIGGFDGVERLRTVECYHPENNEWTVVTPMHMVRSGAGVAVINQYIYVIGGYDGSKQLSTVERYDTERDQWKFVCSMKTARSALSVTVLDYKIYAMGGFDGQNFLANVEVYDPAADQWSVGDPLTSGRSGHASAVCYQSATCPSAGVTGLCAIASQGDNYPCTSSPYKHSTSTGGAQHSRNHPGTSSMGGSIAPH